ncbi:MAG: dTMP kinase [Spirochaetota bacterium]
MKIELPLFILFEGIDGSGKTTLSELLFEFFKKKGVPAEFGHEPTEGVYGKEIRSLLQKEHAGDADDLLKLFLLDREDDAKKNILPSLKAGKAIVMDRYYFSNAAYQGAMGISPESIITENRKRNFPEPDRVYLVDIDPEVAVKRIAGRNNKTEIFEKKDFLKNVREIYHSVADNRFVILDGSKKISEIMKIIEQDILNNFYK